MIPLRLLPQTCTVRILKGTGANGAVYEPAIQLRCRVSVSNRLVRNAAGAEVVSDSRIYYQPTTNVIVGSKITLPGGGRERTVIAATRNVGDRGEELASVDVQ